MMADTPNKKLQDWAVQIQCTGKGNGNKGCGTVILVEESDLFNTTHVQQDQVVMQTSFYCTECNRSTDIDNVPSDIFQRLPNRKDFFRM